MWAVKIVKRVMFIFSLYIIDMSSYSKFIKKTYKPLENKLVPAFKLFQNIKTQNKLCSTVDCTHTCLCRV